MCLKKRNGTIIEGSTFFKQKKAYVWLLTRKTLDNRITLLQKG